MHSNTPRLLQVHCEDPWFSMIKQGIKSVEGRKNTHTYKKLQVGSLIRFSNGPESVEAVVTELREYPSLQAYLEDVTIEKALPGIASLEEALSIYAQWVTPQEIKQYGVLGIFITLKN